MPEIEEYALMGLMGLMGGCASSLIQVVANEHHRRELDTKIATSFFKGCCFPIWMPYYLVRKLLHENEEEIKKKLDLFSKENAIIKHILDCYPAYGAIAGIGGTLGLVAGVVSMRYCEPRPITILVASFLKGSLFPLWIPYRLIYELLRENKKDIARMFK